MKGERTVKLSQNIAYWRNRVLFVCVSDVSTQRGRRKMRREERGEDDERVGDTETKRERAGSVCS